MIESGFNIVDYNIYSANVGTAIGRGICIYVHASLVACQLHISTLFPRGLDSENQTEGEIYTNHWSFL